jgi:hypothetical protein
VVPDAGNALAQAAIAEVFCLRGDSEWPLVWFTTPGQHFTAAGARVIANALRRRPEMGLGVKALIIWWRADGLLRGRLRRLVSISQSGK